VAIEETKAFSSAEVIVAKYPPAAIAASLAPVQVIEVVRTTS